MLEIVREFALDRLIASGEYTAVQRQHADYYLHLAETLAPSLADAHEAVALAELEDEHPNLRAALRWALDLDDISTAARLAVALWQFWGIHAHLSEGRAWLEVVLTRADQAATSERMSPALRAQLLYATGSLTRAQAAYPRATELFTAALAIRRGLGDIQGIAGCLYNLGFIAYEQGDLTRANELHTEARGMVPLLDEVPSTAMYLTSLGNALRAHGQLGDAKQAYAESLELWRSVGRDWGIAEVLTGLGDLAQAQGDADHALAYYRESLTLHAKLGNKLGLATCFAGLARHASTKGQPEQVARLLGAATALREQVGAPRSPAETITDEQAIAAARAALGEETFARAWEQGCRMPLAHLVREVLGMSA